MEYENFTSEIIYTNHNEKDDYILSIIIPCHNSADVIKPMLRSLEDQRFNWNVQLIFVLDNCTDDTYFTIRSNLTNSSFTITIMRACVNYGGVAREIGRTIAKGKYFWSLDSDDYLLRSDAVQTVCNILNELEPKMLRIKYHSDSDGWFIHNYGGVPDYNKTWWANVYKSELCENIHSIVGFIGDDSAFYEDYIKQNEVDENTILTTIDYFYYYVQLKADCVSAQWWLEKNKDSETTSRIAEYYEYIINSGRILK